jgi:hypothetical protein
MKVFAHKQPLSQARELCFLPFQHQAEACPSWEKDLLPRPCWYLATILELCPLVCCHLEASSRDRASQWYLRLALISILSLSCFSIRTTIVNFNTFLVQDWLDLLSTAIAAVLGETGPPPKTGGTRSRAVRLVRSFPESMCVLSCGHDQPWFLLLPALSSFPSMHSLVLLESTLGMSLCSTVPSWDKSLGDVVFDPALPFFCQRVGAVSEGLRFGA